jgi:hypothetical protein
MSATLTHHLDATAAGHLMPRKRKLPVRPQGRRTSDEEAMRTGLAEMERQGLVELVTGEDGEPSIRRTPKLEALLREGRD